ncbi:MAG: RNA-directed DNA polymerase [Lentisphaeria bacterium]
MDDKRFLRLISKWLKAGILEEYCDVVVPEEGTPQGGGISPFFIKRKLANIYLHNVIDEWFEKEVKPRCDGDVFICRYADDFSCGFQYKSDAEKFYEVLPKRLKKYNLEVAEEKTKCIRFSRFNPTMENAFTFLSFDFYWGKDKGGEVRLFRQTARKKLHTTKATYSEFVKKFRHMKTSELMGLLTVKLRGTIIILVQSETSIACTRYTIT